MLLDRLTQCDMMCVMAQGVLEKLITAKPDSYISYRQATTYTECLEKGCGRLVSHSVAAFLWVLGADVLMSSGLSPNHSLPVHSSALISVHLAYKCRQKVR